MTFTDRFYKIMKFVAMILLPSLGTLYFAVAGIWELPAAEQVVGTVTAVDTFLGVLLGLSTKQYNASEAKYDGTLAVEDGADGSTLRLLDVDPVALTTKKDITFKLASK